MNAAARDVASGRRKKSSFLLTWTLVVFAAVCAFVVHLALRGKTVSLGYELGHARAEQARLREVKRVIELEVASYKTPERVEIVARTLLGMETAPPERVIQMAPIRTSSGNAPANDDDAKAGSLANAKEEP